MTRSPLSFAPPRLRGAALIVALALGATACHDAEKEAALRAQVTRGMKSYLATHLDAWLAAAEDLQRAAPTPADRGWDVREDAAAIAAMKDAWLRARWAYELVEGAVAPLFPESDTATDARYDDHLLIVGPRGDLAPFDGDGVIGMHGIERILYADRMPAAVLAFERALPGYAAAAMPATAAEARAFKDGIAARMVEDIRSLRRQFEPLELDLAFAYRGLLDLVEEQVEKVDKTASGEEESRYAQTTMRDLRANLQGARDVYELFRPWLASRRGGRELDGQVLAGFTRLRAAYEAIAGDAMPAPPSTWSSVDPRPADLATPFGRLFSTVKRECDPAEPSSLHRALRAAAERLGLPEAL
jgi:iron uptake system component EfeO